MTHFEKILFCSGGNLYGNRNGISREFDKNSFNLCRLNPGKREKNDKFLIFTLLFSASKRRNQKEETQQRSVKIAAWSPQLPGGT